MVQINKIFINNSEGFSVVTNNNLNIHWLYDNNVKEDDFQLGYEILIGSSSLNIGSDLYVGDIYNSGFVTSKNVFVDINIDIERGESYYGQVRANTVNGSTDWRIFSILANSLPTISDASLYPEILKTGQDIILSYDYSDLDGHSENGTKIYWLKNGIRQPSLDNTLFVNKDLIKKDDIWKAVIIPCDGYENGLSYETNSIFLTFDSVVVENAKINSFPSIDQVVYLEYDFNSNNNSENKSDVFWYLNGEKQKHTKESIFIKNAKVGDVLFAEILPKDEEAEGILVKTNVAIFKEKDCFVEDVIFIEQDTHDIIKWSSNNVFKNTHIKIGKFYGDNSILDIETLGNEYKIEDLEKGFDYYITLAVSNDDNFKNYFYKKINKTGSILDNIENSNGWDLEFLFSHKEKDETKNQTIIMEDGKFLFYVKIYPKKIEIVEKNEIKSIFYNSIKRKNLFKIEVVNNSIKIFANDFLILEGNQYSETKYKKIKILSNDDFKINYYRFSIRVKENNVDDFSLYKIDEIPKTNIVNMFNYIDKDGIYKKILTTNSNNKGRLYKIQNLPINKKYIKMVSDIEINDISKSDNEKYFSVSHNFGISIMNNILLKDDFVTDFEEEKFNNKWNLFKNIDKENTVTFGDKLTINTL